MATWLDMRLTTALGPWTAAFLTTLGLSPMVACGGTTVERTNSNGGGANVGGVSGNTDVYSMAGSIDDSRLEPGGSSNGGRPGGTGGGTARGGSGNVSIDGGAPNYGGTGGDYPYPTGGAGGASSGGVGGKGGSLPCPNPTPLLDGYGKPTGFVSCGGGAVHRPEKQACVSRIPRPALCSSPFAFDAGIGPSTCRTDSDCAGQAHGYCRASQGGQVPGCYCTAGCVNDSECGAGQICLCGDPVGQCAPASCTADDDCGGNSLCLSYTPSPGCPSTAFACQRYDDNCASDKDCPAGMQCSLVNGAHQCRGFGCATGRPFLVGGAARVANVSRREDWTSDLTPDLAGLGTEARAALASRWTEIALMEHASIAAFARFALEIMSLGAPPELLVRTHSAMADETVHARDAFALASAYAGLRVGPGLLDVDAALGARTPRDIVHTAILEGCIGETVAAVEAAEALAHATDPAVRTALARVTVDETAHAELAWRFVQWVLEHADAELREETATLLVAIAEAESAAPARSTGSLPESSAMLRAHGFLDQSTRNELRHRVMDEVVGPCARALMAAHGGARAERECERFAA